VDWYAMMVVLAMGLDELLSCSVSDPGFADIGASFAA
jgi:hypothetical protein